MADLRRRAIRQWTCPNHPDGPPRLPAEGYEREELTLAEAYDEAEVDALRQVVESARRAQLGPLADIVEQMFGLCCVGQTWKTVGYEMVEVSRYESLMLSMLTPLATFPSPSILLAELEGVGGSDTVRIPIITTDKPQ